MLRLPAEWEHSDFLLIAWPHAETDWNYMLDDVCRCYTDLVRAATRFGTVIIATPEPDAVKERLIAEGIDTAKCVLAEVPTNDTWARDFGPITMVDENYAPTLLDFKFNGWGLKFASDKDNLITRRLYQSGVLKGDYANRLNFVLEGGSIESNGRGTLLTTSECLLSLNRNGQFTRNEIEQYLKDAFNVTNVLWLDHGALAGDDTDSHIDTLARLAPHNTIIYAGCQDPEDEHYTELMKMKEELAELRTPEGTPYNLYELPMPDAVYSADGERLPATYANYLVTPRAVFMPTYGNPLKDMTAAGILGAAFEKEVVSIDCLALIEQHGSLHCATMQIPESILI